MRLPVVSALALLAFVPASGAAWAQEVVVTLPAVIQGLKTEQPKYDFGVPVQFTYAVRNRSDKPVTYTFSSSKQYDLWIKRGAQEIYRLSDGKMYATVITTLTLQPDETKTFTVTWNQMNKSGQRVGPGVYTAYAQLAAKGAPQPTTVQFEIGTVKPALVPVTIKDAIKRVGELSGQTVVIKATYRGSQPDPNDSNCKGGPPVSENDWAISDSTGCMWVTGVWDVDRRKTTGQSITVTGELRKSTKGQIYLVLRDATVERSTGSTVRGSIMRP